MTEPTTPLEPDTRNSLIDYPSDFPIKIMGPTHAHFAHTMIEVVRQFEPELLIISAGYDAHWRDPLGRMGLTVGGFAALAAEVKQWAGQLCEGRLVVLMEGGYDLEALAASLAATVEVLLGRPVDDRLGPSPYHEPMPAVEEAIAAARQALAPYWTF